VWAWDQYAIDSRRAFKEYVFWGTVAGSSTGRIKNE